MDYYKLNLFLYLFFHKLEEILNLEENLIRIRSLKLHRDEANTDEQLKELVKEVILNEKNNIIQSLINHTIIYDQESITFEIDSLYEIINVYLPKELTDTIKQSIKIDGRTFTNPDLLIEINDQNNNIYFVPLELKSTKTDSIPGSSVQQIDGDEWVIFVQIKNNLTKVIIGKYLWAINQKMQFPDRSPRPNVSFETMNNWKKKNESYSSNTLKINFPKEDILERSNVIKNWQQVLIDRWIKEVHKPKASSGWFNTVIRNYTFQLLQLYNDLNDKEKNVFINNLNKKED